MEVIKSILDGIAAVVKRVIAVMLGVMLVVALVEVFRRYLFGLSFPWSEELIRYLIIWVSFLGGAVAYKEQNLVFFDMIVDRMHSKYKMVLLMLTNTVSLIFVSYIFSYALRVINKPSIVKQKSIGLQISMLYPYLAIPVGLGLMILFGLYHYRVIYATYKNGGYNK
ncbi:MAG: C4-dicarboxylate transporter, DctQ subunit [Clostridiales bacterium]|nr:C4-dicarboxylate transporter, DctQ subunit [Clostridiales bacterium]MDN5300396.1 C4-dicarboxylate transporter, DctQ subunit [Clostridiales bacterium]